MITDDEMRRKIRELSRSDHADLCRRIAATWSEQQAFTVARAFRPLAGLADGLVGGIAHQIYQSQQHGDRAGPIPDEWAAVADTWIEPATHLKDLTEFEIRVEEIRRRSKWAVQTRSERRGMNAYVRQALYRVGSRSASWWTDIAENLFTQMIDGALGLAPILADALEDGGCDDVELLKALRYTPVQLEPEKRHDGVRAEG